MSLELISVNLEQNSPSVTAGGGETDNWAVVASGLLITLNRRRRVYEYRTEEIGHAGGPGVQSTRELIAVLHVEDYPDGWPAVLVSYNSDPSKPLRFVDAGGLKYLVLFVRDSYEMTLQCEVEVVK